MESVRPHYSAVSGYGMGCGRSDGAGIGYCLSGSSEHGDDGCGGESGKGYGVGYCIDTYSSDMLSDGSIQSSDDAGHGDGLCIDSGGRFYGEDGLGEGKGSGHGECRKDGVGIGGYNAELGDGRKLWDFFKG